MSILGKLSIKPLLYVIGVLLLVVVALGGRGCVLASDRDAAEAAQGRAEAQRDAARTERDAWKERAGQNALASKAATARGDTLKRELDTLQSSLRVLDEQGRRALELAQARATDAERTLTRFTAQFQTESRKPDCERALSALEAACPALRSY